MNVYQHLGATQKCESVRSYQPLICFTFHNMQWKKRSTYTTRDIFLYVSVHTDTGPFSAHYNCLTQLPPLWWQLSSREQWMMQTPSTPARLGFPAQAGWTSSYVAFCQVTSTSLPDVLSTRATGPSCFDSSEEWHGCHTAAVAALAAPTSPFAAATCYTLSCAAPSPQHYYCLWNWTGELRWVKNNLFFCWVIFNSDQFPDPGDHLAARIAMPGCASVIAGWK